jgi:hypothetical protein
MNLVHDIEFYIYMGLLCQMQCFGTASGLDLDSIRSVDPYPDSESGSRSGSRRAKMTHKTRTIKSLMFWKSWIFSFES